MYKQNDSTIKSNETLVNTLILFVWLFLISFPYINKSVCQVVAPPLRWSAGASPGSLERIDVFFGSSHE